MGRLDLVLRFSLFLAFHVIALDFFRRRVIFIEFCKQVSGWFSKNQNEIYFYDCDCDWLEDLGGCITGDSLGRGTDFFSILLDCCCCGFYYSSSSESSSLKTGILSGMLASMFIADG